MIEEDPAVSTNALTSSILLPCMLPAEPTIPQ